MSLFAVEKPTPIDERQSRLMRLAAVFLLLYSLTLTISPAARLHSWQAEYRWGHWIAFVVWLVGMALVNHQLSRLLPERDPYLFPIGALLSGWGLLTIWRLDATMGVRQTIWLAICMVVILAGLRVPNLFVLLRRYKYIWLTSGLLLTALTFLFGVYPGGAGPRLWLGCCGVYLQPSEPLKLLLIAYLAAYLSDRLPVSFNLLRLLTPTLILIGLALVMLVAQRDLGTASLFILIYSVVIYVASQRHRVLVISFVVLLAAGLTGYQLFDVVRVRVDAWLNPWLDPAGRSYQIIQSLMAIAAGGIFGRGPGMGSPALVPVAHSDFIFSSLAEETGLVGIVALLALFALLVARGVRAAMYATNNHRRYLATGLTAYLAMQGIFIIGGNLRLLPLTGVTLPFVSYGGSSLLTAYVSLLLLVLVSSPGEEETAPLHNPTPYLLTGAGLVAGFLALALASGWWAVIRAEGLLSRPENPRRVITDRYVRRGALLDRQNQPINRTIGEPGGFQREYVYPALSSTAGYNSPTYGQAGLESGLDDLLRGLRGNPPTLVLTEQLLYGQTPPGVDVRLTLDLNLQAEADQLLQGHKGALVLVNARSGEILVLSSHPNVDANQLDETWTALRSDPDAPLFNRATQGSYPPGGALGPFLLAYASRDGSLPSISSQREFPSPGALWTCAVEPAAQQPTPADLIASGCPAPAAELGGRIGAQEMKALFESLGFYEAPNLPFEVAEARETPVERVDLAAIGQENLTVTPLQMALAAASVSADGLRPVPRILMGVLTQENDWSAVPETERKETLLLDAAQAAEGLRIGAEALAAENGLYWQTIASARGSQQSISWYLAGTLEQWQGDPLALAVVLEDGTPAEAASIGQSLLDTLAR